MAYSSLIKELASAINEVVSVISWTVLSALPIILAIFITTIVTAIFIDTIVGSDMEEPASYMEGSANTQTLMMSKVEQPELKSE
jgi:hypothetical protein